MGLAEQGRNEQATARVNSLITNIVGLQGEHINHQHVASIYRSARGVATDVMHLNPLAANIFAVRLGNAVINHATLQAFHRHLNEDGSYVDFPANNPAYVGRTTALYLFDHFTPHNGRRGAGSLMYDLEEKVRRAGITTDFINQLEFVADEVARDLLRRSSNNLSVAYFESVASRFAITPGFSLLQGDAYTAFIKQLGGWLEKEVDTKLDNLVTGKYLAEQEELGIRTYPLPTPSEI